MHTESSITKQNKRLLSCFFLWWTFFLSSCGLDTVISINEPTITDAPPLYNSDDYLTWYFSFTTNERNQQDSFVGTEIYYKIYNNSSNLVSQRNAINSVNYTSNGTAAATKMIDTYTYQPLGTNPVIGNSPFIESTGTNTDVVLRLKTYTGNESYMGENIESFRACLKIAGELQTSTGGEYIVPFRIGNTKSFDFFDDDNDDLSGTRDVEPENGDSDFYYNSSPSSTDTYYVQLFAVGVAFDSDNLSNTYSLVLDLGSVPIKKGS